MFVYCDHGLVCSCRDAVTAWWPTGYRHRFGGSSSPPCSGPVAGRADSARSPGVGRAVSRRRAPEGGHSPARAGGGAGHIPQPCPRHVRSQLSRGKPDARIDELAVIAASGHVVSGVLVRSGRLARARACGSGRAGGRSRPSCRRASPWLGRSLAKRRCDAARDRRSRLSRPGHPRATR